MSGMGKLIWNAVLVISGVTLAFGCAAIINYIVSRLLQEYNMFIEGNPIMQNVGLSASV